MIDFQNLPFRTKPYWSVDCRSLFFVNETAGSSYNESRLAVVHKHVSKFIKKKTQIYFSLSDNLTFMCIIGRTSTSSFKETF